MALIAAISSDFNFSWKTKKTPLTLAAQHDSCDIVMAFLAKGALDVADGVGERAVSIAARNGNSDVLKLLLSHSFAFENENGTHALYHALAAEYELCVRVLLRMGSPVNGIGLDDLYMTNTHLREIVSAGGFDVDSLLSDVEDSEREEENENPTINIVRLERLCIDFMRSHLNSKTKTSNLFVLANQLPLPKPLVEAITYGVSL